MRFYASPADDPERPSIAQTVTRVVGTFRPYRGKVGDRRAGRSSITSALGVVNPLLIKLIFDHGALRVGPPATCQGGRVPTCTSSSGCVALMIVIPIITGDHRDRTDVPARTSSGSA